MSDPVVPPDYLTHHEELYRERRSSGRYEGWETGYANAKADLSRIIRSGRAPTFGVALELGCGAGNMAIWLAKQGFEIHGIDVSPTAIEWANENAAAEGVPCSFNIGNVLDEAAYPSSKLDFVLDGHLLHCIIGRDRKKLLRNVRNALKAGGYFLVRHVLSPVDERLTKRYRFDPASLLLFHGDVPYRYLPTFAMLRAELEESGFRLMHAELTYDLSAERGFQLATFEAST